MDAYTHNLRICVARITPPQFALLSTCASPACDGLTVRYILDWTPDCELRLQRPGELLHGGNGTLAALLNGTYSALIIAAAQGHTDACTELCRNERYKQALNATSKDGSTDLQMTARQFHGLTRASVPDVARGGKFYEGHSERSMGQLGRGYCQTDGSPRLGHRD